MAIATLTEAEVIWMEMAYAAMAEMAVEAVAKVARAEETGKVKRTMKVMEVRGPTNLAHEDSTLHV